MNLLDNPFGEGFLVLHKLEDKVKRSLCPTTSKWSFNGFLSTVNPRRTRSVSQRVKTLPSIALGLQVYSTVNCSFHVLTAPGARGRNKSRSCFNFVILEKTLVPDSLPSTGLLASSGIRHVFPSKMAPSILPLWQSTLTRLSEIPHFLPLLLFRYTYIFLYRNNQ